MLNLVIDARMLRSSGIGSYLQGLIPLISEDHDVTLLVSDRDIDLYSRYRNVRTITCSSPIYSIKEQVELPLKIPPCDIFWSPHYNVPLLPIRAKRRLVTIHDVFHLAFYKSLTPSQKYYAKFMLHSAVRSPDSIITVSNFSKSEILKYLKTDETRIRVIHNGINNADYRVLNSNEFLDTGKNLGLPDKYILFVGNVKPHKNLKNLLMAYKILRERELKDHSLVIIGQKDGFITSDSDLFTALDNDTALKENVMFTGHIEQNDLPLVYNAASLLVFPSLYEGFGLPPLEAMACGCPVIVSNAASLPEVCGDAAYYVDPDNIEDIASGIQKVLEEDLLRQDLTARGLERVKLFNWKKSAEEHMKVFTEVQNN